MSTPTDRERLAAIRERLEGKPPETWWSQVQAREDLAYLLGLYDQLTQAFTGDTIQIVELTERVRVLTGALHELGWGSWSPSGSGPERADAMARYAQEQYHAAAGTGETP